MNEDAERERAERIMALLGKLTEPSKRVPERKKSGVVMFHDFGESAEAWRYIKWAARGRFIVDARERLKDRHLFLVNHPHGMAFDAAGNLFVAETIRDTGGDILEFTSGGRVVFASGLNRPEYLTFGPPR